MSNNQGNHGEQYSYNSFLVNMKMTVYEQCPNTQGIRQSYIQQTTNRLIAHPLSESPHCACAGQWVAPVYGSRHSPYFCYQCDTRLCIYKYPPPLILKLFHIIEKYLHGFRVILVGPWQSVKRDTESLWGLLAMPEAVGISIQVFLPGIVVIF